MLDCRGPASAVVVEQLVGAAVSVAREAPVGDVSAPLPRVGLCGNETLRPDGREDAAVTVQVCLEVDSVGVAVASWAMVAVTTTVCSIRSVSMSSLPGVGDWA
ncbi:hypothetical protein GS901_26955 [Rhodococcus hoagii]|nr:hypothetical protein [Prescottella equi]